MVTIFRQCRSWHVARSKLGILWTTLKILYLNNRTTAGSIGLRLGIQLDTQQTIHVCGSPQGDRPLPAPREAGPWAPAFGGAGLGRLGEWRPPGPSCFRFHYCFFFFCLALCSYAGLSNRVTERDSAVRGCRAALSHMVPFVCCLLPCLIVFFSWHTHLIADIRFSTRC